MTNAVRNGAYLARKPKFMGADVNFIGLPPSSAETAAGRSERPASSCSALAACPGSQRLRWRLLPRLVQQLSKMAAQNRRGGRSREEGSRPGPSQVGKVLRLAAKRITTTLVKAFLMPGKNVVAGGIWEEQSGSCRAGRGPKGTPEFCPGVPAGIQPPPRPQAHTFRPQRSNPD